MADFWTQYREQLQPVAKQASAGLLNDSQLQGAVNTAIDPILGQPLRQSFSTIFPWSGMVNYDDKYNIIGWKTPFQSNFMAPTAGAVGPGGAISGGGLGATNDNPFDINAPGAGLWAAGYDVNDPNQVANLYSTLSLAGALKKPEFAGFAPAPGTQLGTPELQNFLNAADWYYRDQARQVDKQNKFGDSMIGKLVLGGLTAASGGAFGPIGGALFGAGLGSASSNPGLGALTGAAGGFGAGLVSNAGGLGNLIKNPSSGFSGILGGPSASGVVSGAAGNAVPGFSTGITTPTGGGLVGSGALNPAGVGILGNTAAGGVSLSPNVLSGLASITQTPGSAPIQHGPTNPPIPGPAANQTAPPGILEAVGDLYKANGGIAGLAGDALGAFMLANNVSGLLSGPKTTAVSAGGGLLNQGWGGKFKKYESPYGPLGRMPMKRGIQTNIAGARTYG